MGQCLKLKDVRALIKKHGLSGHVGYDGPLEYLPAQMFGKLHGVYLFWVHTKYWRRFRAFCRMHRIQDVDGTVWSYYPDDYRYRAIILPPEKFEDRRPSKRKWRRIRQLMGKKKTTTKLPATAEEADRLMHETGKLHFYIYGEDFTRLARTLMMEGNWRKALHMVLDGLQGMTYEYAIGVLQGKHKFQGRSDVGEGLDMLPEHKNSKEVKEYVKQLAYIYGGRIELGNANNRWFKPYAFVASYGIDDVGGPYDVDVSPPFVGWDRKSKMMAQSHKRAMYYASNPFSDRAFNLKYEPAPAREAWVLFEQCEAPPIWWPVLRTPQDALNSLTATGAGLWSVGAVEGGGGRRSEHRWGDSDDVEDEDIVAAKKDIANRTSAIIINKRIELNAKQQMAKNLMAELPPEMMGNVGDILEATMGDGKELDEPPVPDPELSSENGIIMSDGTYYPCRFMAHKMLGDRIVRFILELKDERNPEGKIDEIGCIRITSNVMGTHIICGGKANDVQKAVVEKWKKLHDDDEKLVELDCYSDEDEEEDGECDETEK